MTHVIDAISFAAGHLFCSCNKVVNGHTPDDLAEAFRQHRREAGETVNTKPGWAPMPFSKGSFNRTREKS